MTLDDMIGNQTQFRGKQIVTFRNGEARGIDVERNIIDPHGHPVYLVSTSGVFYNWQNIISVRKA